MPKDDDDYQKHIRERKEQPPEFLHKYVTMETARLILGSGKMRFQSPIRYNDPFDSQWDPFWSLKTDEALSIRRELIHAQFQSTNSQEKIDAFIDSLKSVDQVEREYRPNLVDERRRLRVLCLSAIDTNVTMWSHYAEEHRGIVLTFNSGEIQHGVDHSLQRVIYRDQPPSLFDPTVFYGTIIDQQPFPGPTGDVRQWTLTKSCDWAYEKEWRMGELKPRGTLGDYEDQPVPTGSLAKLTMGCRADRKAFHDLYALALAWNPDIKLREAFIPLGSLQLKLRDLDPAAL